MHLSHLFRTKTEFLGKVDDPHLFVRLLSVLSMYLLYQPSTTIPLTILGLGFMTMKYYTIISAEYKNAQRVGF